MTTWTPRTGTTKRTKITLDGPDDQKVRDMGTKRGRQATVTDTSGRKWLFKTASCGLPACHCDMIARRL